ncbi:DUF4367 domain-containing protein [Sellimonas intestinalis]|uniref:DUF4367 domain-containing protein n=1 Tax=Sellimonas intestinalis TaxID=1653434 RepID=UPI0015EBDA0D|nr:DUF4367 domain-containing protein [Sellimonas intestinalis]MBA2214706.1 DUF4367 domain-containing protein [Sellimonas intestinalis]
MKSTIWRRAEEIRKQKEAYDNLSEADKEALRLGREFQLRREEKEKEEISEELVPESLELAAGAEERRHSNQAETGKTTRKVHVGKRRKKAMVALVAALVAVLGLGITSFGDKGYVAETVKQLLGERKLTNIDTDHEGKEETINTSEENVYQNIKDNFGFDPVRLDYKPFDMEMVDSSIDTTLLTANIYYMLNENMITYTIIPVYRDASSGYDIEDKEVEQYEKQVENVEITVTEYVIEDSGQHEFSAEFQYQDVSYFLTGVIEKDEFEKILENLHFF